MNGLEGSFLAAGDAFLRGLLVFLAGLGASGVESRLSVVITIDFFVIIVLNS
tara:strand:- start:23 stop:178 length:156 start_codon:yes stop_codon:yes gene_type:complete